MIDTKNLISILEQHKLNDAQSEELQKVIYSILDGRLVEASDAQENAPADGEETKIEVSYFLHTVFVKEGKAFYKSDEFFKDYKEVKTAFDNAVQDEMRYGGYFNCSEAKYSVKNTDREFLAYPCDKYDELRTHIWIEEHPELVRIVKE